MNDKVDMSTESIKDIEEHLGEIKDRTAEFVKEHPITSIAIAAGVGFIIAKLISGRHS